MRAKGLQVYLREDVPEEKRILEYLRKNSRMQERFRSLLFLGFEALLKTGDFEKLEKGIIPLPKTNYREAITEINNIPEIPVVKEDVKVSEIKTSKVENLEIENFWETVDQLDDYDLLIFPEREKEESLSSISEPIVPKIDIEKVSDVKEVILESSDKDISTTEEIVYDPFAEVTKKKKARIGRIM